MQNRTTRGLGLGWCDVISEGFNSKYPSCSLCFDSNYLKQAKKRQTNSAFWFAKAHCRTGNCIQATFKVQNQPMDSELVMVVVNVSGKLSHCEQEQPNRRKLSGLNRVQTMNDIENSGVSASTYYYTKLSKMGEQEINYGNTSKCQTPSVLRQGVYEHRKRTQLHDNDITELNIQRQAFCSSMPGKHLSGFVQTIALYPFSFLMCCERQIKTYVKFLSENDETTLHFDATGSVVKVREKTDHNTLYLYSAVLADGSLPVFEFVSSWHKSFAIQSHIDIFNGLVKTVNNGQLPKPRYIVTDFSFALINACMKSFNNMNLVTYLKECHSILMKKATQEHIRSLTFTVLCVSHIMKSLTVRLKKVNDSCIQRKAVMVWFCGLQRCTTMNGALIFYRDMYIVLNNINEDDSVIDARKRLTQACLGNCGLTKGVEDFIDETITAPDDDDDVVSVPTIKQASPFTSMFGNFIKPLSSDDSTTCAPVKMNANYSPASFASITDIIHLFPLWSCLLQSNVTRLGNNGATDNNNFTVRCLSNATVESHFKGLKTGRMGKKMKVRPRTLVEAEVQYVIGKLNELNLPKNAKTTKRRTKANEDDITLSSEQWKVQKKKKATYSNPGVVLRTLTKSVLTKRASKRAATYSNPPVDKLKQKTDHAPIKKVKKTFYAVPQKRTGTQKRKSPEIFVTKNVDNMLVATKSVTRAVMINSDNIENAFSALKPTVPNLRGLESSGLGAYYRHQSMPRFSAVPNGDKFLQILHVPLHWICVSNVHATTPNEVFVYDSSPSGKLHDEAITQLTCLLRLWEDSDSLLIRMRNCAIQPETTLPCGYYAIAAAVAICQGSEPTLWRYDHNRLIEFVKKGLAQRKFDILKADTVVKEKVNVKSYTEPKRHCLCQNVSSGSMIQCTRCQSWYHQACVSITKKQRYRQSLQWLGPCCEHLQKRKDTKR